MATGRPARLGDRLKVPRRERATPETPAAPEQPRSVASHLQDVVIITGFSGAGKSTAMAAFEDAGYFCVDNLPPRMIRSLVELFIHEGSKVERAAVVSDVRGGDYFDALLAVLDDLRALGIAHRVLFLDADEQTLLNRYKETRRRHPLAPASNITHGIDQERSVLAPLRERADLVIDTTGLGPNALRRRIAEEMLTHTHPGPLVVTLTSFGFKHGPPRDADLVFDVRFLPNPHYVANLRPLTGHDKRVVEYVGRDGLLDEFYARLFPLVDFLVPHYIAEGKAHLVMAIGCTGGRHRSVAIAEHLAARYRERDDVVVEVVHRDVDRFAG